MLGASATAWTPGVTWGDARTPSGDAVAWGVACSDTGAECTLVPWRVACGVEAPDCEPPPLVDAPSMDAVPTVEPDSGDAFDNTADARAAIVAPQAAHSSRWTPAVVEGARG
jgi:hypothetical protein